MKRLYGPVTGQHLVPAPTDKKFTVGLDPLEEETKLTSIQPLSTDSQKRLLKIISDAIASGKLDKTSNKAFRMWRANLKANRLKGWVNSEFQRDFWAWLLGRGKEDDQKKCFWYRQSLADDPEVRAYVDSFIVKRMEYMTKLELLRRRRPVGINQTYLFFKYIVRGEDSANEFLSDWKIFQDEFDTAVKRQYWMDNEKYVHPHEMAPWGDERKDTRNKGNLIEAAVKPDKDPGGDAGPNAGGTGGGDDDSSDDDTPPRFGGKGPRDMGSKPKPGAPPPHPPGPGGSNVKHPTDPNDKPGGSGVDVEQRFASFFDKLTAFIDQRSKPYSTSGETPPTNGPRAPPSAPTAVYTPRPAPLDTSAIAAELDKARAETQRAADTRAQQLMDQMRTVQASNDAAAPKKLADAEKQHDALMQEHLQLQSGYRQMHAHAVQMDAENKALLAQISAMDTDEARVTIDNQSNRLIAEKQALNEAIGKLQTENQDLEAAHAAEVTQLRGTIKQLQDQLTASMSSVSDIHAQNQLALQNARLLATQSQEEKAKADAELASTHKALEAMSVAMRQPTWTPQDQQQFRGKLQQLGFVSPHLMMDTLGQMHSLQDQLAEAKNQPVVTVQDPSLQNQIVALQTQLQSAQLAAQKMQADHSKIFAQNNAAVATTTRKEVEAKLLPENQLLKTQLLTAQQQLEYSRSQADRTLKLFTDKNTDLQRRLTASQQNLTAAVATHNKAIEAANKRLTTLEKDAKASVKEAEVTVADTKERYGQEIARLRAIASSSQMTAEQKDAALQEARRREEELQRHVNQLNNQAIQKLNELDRNVDEPTPPKMVKTTVSPPQMVRTTAPAEPVPPQMVKTTVSPPQMIRTTAPAEPVPPQMVKTTVTPPQFVRTTVPAEPVPPRMVKTTVTPPQFVRTTGEYVELPKDKEETNEPTSQPARTRQTSTEAPPLYNVDPASNFAKEESQLQAEQAQMESNTQIPRVALTKFQQKLAVAQRVNHQRRAVLALPAPEPQAHSSDVVVPGSILAERVREMVPPAPEVGNVRARSEKDDDTTEEVTVPDLSQMTPGQQVAVAEELAKQLPGKEQELISILQNAGSDPAALQDAVARAVYEINQSNKEKKKMERLQPRRKKTATMEEVD